MAVEYQDSALVSDTIQRLEVGSKIHNPTLARDVLMCAIVLDQMKRAGDIAHMAVDSITAEVEKCRALAAKGQSIPEAHVIEVSISAAIKILITSCMTLKKSLLYEFSLHFRFLNTKPRPRKTCRINLTKNLWRGVKLYLRHVRGVFVKNTTHGYLFTTDEGEPLTPSACSKCLKRAWARYWGDKIPSEVPHFTACLMRKSGVTAVSVVILIFCILLPIWYSTYPYYQ